MLPWIKFIEKKFKDTTQKKKVKHEQRKYSEYTVSILEVQGLTESRELDFPSMSLFLPPNV